jgi:hypothetical protein
VNHPFHEARLDWGGDATRGEDAWRRASAFRIIDCCVPAFRRHASTGVRQGKVQKTLGEARAKVGVITQEVKDAVKNA